MYVMRSYDKWAACSPDSKVFDKHQQKYIGKEQWRKRTLKVRNAAFIAYIHIQCSLADRETLAKFHYDELTVNKNSKVFHWDTFSTKYFKSWKVVFQRLPQRISKKNFLEVVFPIEDLLTFEKYMFLSRCVCVTQKDKICFTPSACAALLFEHDTLKRSG